MISIIKNEPPNSTEIDLFLKKIEFKLPLGFIDFFKEANGADISTDENYILLWPITDMIQLNGEYSVNEYAPDFFIFGSDGGTTAFAIEKTTGYIYEIPFIGMSKEEAIFIAKTFSTFLSKNGLQ